MKRRPRMGLLQGMGDQDKQNSTQPDKNVAAEERPVPSQAEGDRETVERDLADKTERDKRSAAR